MVSTQTTNSCQELLGPDLSKALRDASHVLAQEIVSHELPSPLGLSSPKQKSAQLEKELNDAFEQLGVDSTKAATVLLKEVQLLSRTRPEINFEKVMMDLQQLGENFRKETSDVEALKADSSKMFHLQETIHLPKDTLLALFQGAAHILSEKKFEDALQVFGLLCRLAPHDYDHWVGYGHSSFYNKNYDIAIQAYCIASCLRSNEPWPLIWGAKACEKMNDPDSALELLMHAQQLAHESTDKETSSLEGQIQNFIIEMKSKKKK